jgi:ribosome-binding ATPase YchF (GTP1/OBG family)
LRSSALGRVLQAALPLDHRTVVVGVLGELPIRSAAVVISAEIESETAVLSDEEQNEFLDSLGLEERGLNRVIRAGYELLGLQTYFAVGPKEAGKARQEGKEYVVQDCDVMHFRFNV